MTDLFLISLIGGIAVLFLVLVVAPAMFAKPSVAAASILGILIIESAGLPTTLPLVGSYQIFLQDVLFVILGIIGFYRVIFLRSLSIMEILLLCFGLLIFVSFLRGLSFYGLELSANNVRPNLYFFCGILYFSISPINKTELNRIALGIISAAGILTAIALYQWLFGGSAWIQERLAHRDAYTAIRTLGATTVLVIAQATMIAFCASKQRSKVSGMQLLGICFLLVIVVMPHRSVWVATILALTTLIVLDVRLRAHLPSLTAMGLLFGIFIAPLLIFSSNIPFIDAIANAVIEPFMPNSTISWRTVGWENIVSYYFSGNLFDILFGLPAGETSIVGVQRAINIGHAHSNYLDVFMTTGALGFAILAVIVGTMFKKLSLFRSATFDAYINPNLMISNIVLMSIFYIVYNQSYEQSIFVGVSLAFLKSYGLRYSPQANTASQRTTAAPRAPKLSITPPVSHAT